MAKESNDSVGQIGLDLVVNKNDFEKQMTGIRDSPRFVYDSLGNKSATLQQQSDHPHEHNTSTFR